MGTNGMVGQWDYMGKDATKPRHMAIKQAAPADKVDLMVESKMLHLLASTGSEHIVRLYKAAHASPGTGTMDEQDPLPFDDNGVFDEDEQVYRMYLELADGGDMFRWMRKLTPPANKPPEEHLWRILLCMAKALHVLEYGSEDPAARNTSWSKCQIPNALTEWMIYHS